ncbi:hypothetical protein BDN71DRAFT_1459075 [Pleurotus eryngii]|uniref:Uncharacterized protein n=1 Tax=Pleurotus eryngii TaxID=5323 RepID=A0A9P5ZGW2_PLEER|nr:hypothetical protein BDN71DRAFT_1459075 [Pleurotus eryngii]
MLLTSAEPAFATFYVLAPTSHLRKGDYAFPRYMTCSVVRDAPKNREDRGLRTCRLLFDTFGPKMSRSYGNPPSLQRSAWLAVYVVRSKSYKDLPPSALHFHLWPADFTHFRARSKVSASRAECEPNEGDHEERTRELANPRCVLSAKCQTRGGSRRLGLVSLSVKGVR